MSFLPFIWETSLNKSTSQQKSYKQILSKLGVGDFNLWQKIWAALIKLLEQLALTSHNFCLRSHTCFLEEYCFTHSWIVYRDVLSKNSHKFQIILSSRNISSFAVKFFMMVAIDNNRHRCCTALIFGPPATLG